MKRVYKDPSGSHAQLSETLQEYFVIEPVCAATNGIAVARYSPIFVTEIEWFVDNLCDGDTAEIPINATELRQIMIDTAANTLRIAKVIE